MLTDPYIQYILEPLRVLQPLCLCTCWAINDYLSKDFAVYDDARMIFVAMDQMLLLLSFMINICWKFDLVWIMIFSYCRRQMLVLLSLKQIRLRCFFYFFFFLRVWVLLRVLQLKHTSGTEKKTPLTHLVQVPTESAMLTKRAQSCSPPDCPTDKGMD